MRREIADYALIGDCQTAALVHRDGAIDWLCWPRFDSEACFAALLGNQRQGRWRIAPCQAVDAVHRRYVGETLILETEFVCETGRVALIDFMPHAGGGSDLIRIVEGREGHVDMQSMLALRFDYGRVAPLIRGQGAHALVAIAGPHAVALEAPDQTRSDKGTFLTDFRVREGQQCAFTLSYFPSHRAAPGPVDVSAAFRQTENFWREFIDRADYRGPFSAEVRRSLLTLKALTHRPTGGIVAAPTASLPEWPGGARNWDYRFCWLRDATFTLLAFLHAGLADEAAAWTDWLVRAAAGEPTSIRPLYRIDGARHPQEWEAPWLQGFAGSQPVRFGNDAGDQVQLDIYGELVQAFHFSRRHGIPHDQALHRLELLLLRHLESVWRQPDSGMWESRGRRRHHTLSKVMAWAAFSLGSSHDFPAADCRRWRTAAAEIRRAVLRRGFDRARGCFVRAFDEPVLDASTLRMPMVGFLPAQDARMRGTVQAVERYLTQDGFVRRYEVRETEDGMRHAPEGAFLACSFWLATNYILQNRQDEALRLIEHLLSTANDVGLLPEEIDPETGRMLGNFPQAFSHLALVNAAASLRAGHGPAGELQAHQKDRDSPRDG